MRFFICFVVLLLSQNVGKTFTTSHICIPSLYGNTKVASGLIYVKTGDVVKLQKPFGWADYLKQTPFTPHTQIYIGSLKKQFIAAAILKLMNENKLKLDDPVSTYLKFSKMLIAKDPAWVDNTTIHHLLTHVSNVYALPIQESNPQLSYLDRVYMGSESIPNPLTFRYNSAAYGVLEHLIQVVSGMSVIDYITQNFIKPFEMHQTLFNSGVDVPNRIRNMGGSNLCYPYNFLKNKDVVVSVYNPHIQRPFGSADMISTVEDLCKWNTALYSGRVFNTSSEKANRLLQLMQGLYTLDEEGDSYYGYGIKTFVRNGKKIYWHEGLVAGASVYLEYMPESDTSIVVISNTSGVSFNAKTGTYVLEHISDGVFE